MIYNIRFLCTMMAGKDDSRGRPSDGCVSRSVTGTFWHTLDKGSLKGEGSGLRALSSAFVSPLLPLSFLLQKTLRLAIASLGLASRLSGPRSSPLRASLLASPCMLAWLTYKQAFVGCPSVFFPAARVLPGSLFAGYSIRISINHKAIMAIAQRTI